MGSYFKSYQLSRFSQLPCDLITTQLRAPFRGQGGISLLKQHKRNSFPLQKIPGVESGCTRRLVDCLSGQDLGCRSVQGKLLFPPVPSAQTEWIATAAHGGLFFLSLSASLPFPSLCHSFPAIFWSSTTPRTPKMYTFPSLPRLVGESPANKGKEKEGNSCRYRSFCEGSQWGHMVH